MQLTFVFNEPLNRPPVEPSAAQAPPLHLRELDERGKPLIRIRKYKPNSRDAVFRKRVKGERGSCCENCGWSGPLGALQVHHILESAIWADFARERMNVLVLCQGCHTAVSRAETNSAAQRLAFYAGLPRKIRERHYGFLKEAPCAPPALLSVFSSGGEARWREAAIRALCR